MTLEGEPPWTQAEGSIHPVGVRARRCLPIRLEPRAGGVGRRAANDQSGPFSAGLQATIPTDSNSAKVALSGLQKWKVLDAERWKVFDAD